MAGPYPSDQGNPAGAIPVYITSGSGGSTSSVAGPAETGVSLDDVVVGTTASVIVAAGALKGWATIQNSSATQAVYISFNTPTSSSFALQPGSAITLQFGPKNALNGLASAAGAIVNVIGY